MLQVNQLSGFGSGQANVSLIDILTALGLTTNLKLCLDAGDSVSYDGTSQDWVDRSGAGNAETAAAAPISTASRAAAASPTRCCHEAASMLFAIRARGTRKGPSTA